MVDMGEGRFEPRDVKLGHAATAMSRSARASRRRAVVVNANFLIDAESNLKAALKAA